MPYNEKQIQILHTAEKLFACKGYDGTSVRDIAEEAGINIAMISYYFGSKEKLMQALFEERANYMVGRLESLLQDSSLGPLEKLFFLIDDHIERAFARQRFYRIMLSEQILDKSQVIRDHMYAIKQKLMESIDQLLRQGQEAGVFKAGVDVLLLMNAITGTVMQSLVNQEYYKRFHKQQDLPEAAFLSGLKARTSDFLKNFVKAILVYEP